MTRGSALRRAYIGIAMGEQGNNVSRQAADLFVLAPVILQLVVIYVPTFNERFHTQLLGLAELGFCAALPMLVVLAVELEKALQRRWGRSMPTVQQAA